MNTYDITVNGPISHLVVKGDTLYNICKRYNVTVDQLKKWNKLSDINIQLGQKLQVSE
ncbi:LysM peptidoglycan-binding domain-containing protein [Bacteroidia bacterium]|nr:LysM peptidoglycan-binding domain-containing protein [Bacteroidia bacterium]